MESPIYGKEWAEPSSTQEARDRIERLTTEIKQIASQMADPERLDSQGKRLSYRAYKRWKADANRAKMHKENERRFLQEWLRQRNMPPIAPAERYKRDKWLQSAENPSILLLKAQRRVSLLENLLAASLNFRDYPDQGKSLWLEALSQAEECVIIPDEVKEKILNQLTDDVSANS